MISYKLQVDVKTFFGAKVESDKDRMEKMYQNPAPLVNCQLDAFYISPPIVKA
jgi:hypothetical protein